MRGFTPERADGLFEIAKHKNKRFEEEQRVNRLRMVKNMQHEVSTAAEQGYYGIRLFIEKDESRSFYGLNGHKLIIRALRESGYRVRMKKHDSYNHKLYIWWTPSWWWHLWNIIIFKKYKLKNGK